MTLTTNVVSGSAATALVDLEVYSASGKKVYQAYWDRQAFSAGVARSFSAQWTPPRSLAPGTYTVKVGIFAPGWSGLYAWNNGATTFTVR